MAKTEPKTRFHRFQNRGAVAAWERHLNRRWPYRFELVRVIQDTLALLYGPEETLHVAEVATGPGMMARHLLSTMPGLEYTGLDFSDPFVDYACYRLQRFSPRVRILHVDINEDAWLHRIRQPVDAFVSIQSIHDLGGEAQVARIYRKAHALLAARGCFINADFVVPPLHCSRKDPGRLPIARHFELFHDAGYAWADCLARRDSFACLIAGKTPIALPS